MAFAGIAAGFTEAALVADLACTAASGFSFNFYIDLENSPLYPMVSNLFWK